MLGSRCSQSAGIAAGVEEAVGPGWAHPEGRKKTGHCVLRGLQVGGTSHCCSSNIKTENPSRETGMIKAVQKCRCLSGFPGSVEASKHISLLVLAAVGKQKPSAFRLSGARSRLSPGSASPAVPRGEHASRLCPKEQPACFCAAAFSKDIGC